MRVGGLCIGGTLSLSIAAELGDEVAALTLLSTTLWYDGWAMPWYRPFRYLGYIWPIRYWYTYNEREPFGLKNEQLRRWVAREMAHKDASMVGASRLNLPAIQEAERMIAAVKKTMSRITAPAIIIHAVEDEVASPRSAHYIAEHIGSRTVESVMLHNSYHMITVDNDREQVASDTIRFFDKRARPTCRQLDATASVIIRANLFWKQATMSSLQTIQNMMVKQFDLKLEDLTPDATLEGLGLDSLSVIEFTFNLEDELKITMPEERVELKTLQDVVNLVDKIVAEQKGAAQ